MAGKCFRFTIDGAGGAHGRFAPVQSDTYILVRQLPLLELLILRN
jgi:hypothetical protein